MGFGTLFFGYFLLLNITYYGFTDIIAALIMLYAFYKLSEVNSGFRRASWATLAFAAFSLYELGFAVFDMFFMSVDIPSLNSANAMLRSLIVCIVTMLMLIGIRDVSAEVGLGNLTVRAKRAATVSFVIYMLNIIWQTSGLLGFIGVKAVAVIGAFIILSTLLIIAVNLFSIYACYANICMPEDNKPREEKKSRFGFVNAFRAHEAEKQREYYEYKLEKARSRADKMKSKQNGRKKK